MSERILAVDDEPDLLELVEYNLRDAGYTVTTARTARARSPRCGGSAPT